MKLKNILIELENNILIVTINRPQELNVLNMATLLEIEKVLALVYKDPKISGVLITGSGSKSFIAGADIKEFSAFSKEQGKKMVEKGQFVLKIIEESPKPILAAVNGFALGGGCELAMSCHLRIASLNAKFGQPEVKLGIIPGYGGTQRLHQIIGKSKAMELLLTGKSIDASEALNLGLVNYIVASEELMTKSIELLNQVIENSPIAIGSIIKASNAHYNCNEDGFKTEISEFSQCFGSTDFDEGIDAFISKRKPNFFRRDG